MRRLLLIVGTLALLWVLGACATQKDPPSINLAHLNHLYDWAQLEDGTPLAIIYIYAEYPDYRPVVAQGEGFTCVDDIARAAVVYERYARYFNDSDALAKARSLIRTLLKLQAGNGCFYNFLRKNGTIETHNRNSQPLPDWWTWRAFWALTEFGLHQGKANKALGDSIRLAVERLRPHIQALARKQGEFETVQGFRVPLWLPQTYGADQASILLNAMVNTFRWTGDSSWLPLMRVQAEGILAMQVCDHTSETDGMFLSYKNFWHAYGNSQADALLAYFEVSGDSSAFRAALHEINSFYPFLIREGYLHALTLTRRNGRVAIEQKVRFEQIAYDFRPAIWACLKAYRLTGQEKYAYRARKFLAWFSGDNAARRAMYDAQTGRCFDGILSPQKINLNAGAESTIEALLSLLEMQAK